MYKEISYRIQHRFKDDTEWVYSSVDSVAYAARLVEGYSHTLRGFASRQSAVIALREVKEANAQDNRLTFRLVRVETVQTITLVPT